MTIRAVRIVKSKFAATAFSGLGARRFGGRWNSPGSAVVYVAGSASLAILEMLVHLNAHELMNRYVLFDVTIDESLISPLDPAALPRNWRRSPPPAALQRLGDAWLAAVRTAALCVPGSIVPTEWNYLLNPGHPDFAAIKTGPKRPVQFDPRLIKMPAS